ncbi:MAG: ABC transporter substrate-binding protein [Nitrospiraceae bacterium]|nr:ABC transporter substrate-binding protein [Nitrospiraceae bacterium]
MNQRLKLIVAGLGIIFLSVVSVDPLARSQDESIKVRIGYLNITASLPLFVAEEKGFLTDERLKYEALPMATSNQLVDGIVAGNLDVFVESSAVPVLAVEIQSPGRLKVFSVSSITKKAPFDALMVKNDSLIKNLSDLAGKKIGVFPGSTATNLLKKYLADHEVDISGITFIPIPPQNQITSLLTGSIDALHAYEPAIAIGLDKGARRLCGSVYADMLEPNPQGVAAVSTKLLQKHPRLAHKVINALERAMVFMREHEMDARQILARRMSLQREIANRSVFLYMLPHREIDASIFQRYADMLTELGELRGRVSVDGLLYRD